MSRNSHEESPFPFLIDDRFHLSAIGRRKKGGWLKITFDNQQVEPLVPLSQTAFALTALLILAAKKSISNGWAAAFLSAEVIAPELYRWTKTGNSDPANVAKAVFRLRARIDKSRDGKPTINSTLNLPGWDRRAVEHQEFLGYRFSLPPENQHLELLDEEKDNPGDCHPVQPC